MPARNRDFGSGGCQYQTAHDSNKHTVLEPQLLGCMAVLGKSSPGKCGSQVRGRPSEAASASTSRVAGGPAGGDWRVKLGAAAVKRDCMQGGGGSSMAARRFAGGPA